MACFWLRESGYQLGWVRLTLVSNRNLLDLRRGKVSTGEPREVFTHFDPLRLTHLAVTSPPMALLPLPRGFDARTWSLPDNEANASAQLASPAPAPAPGVSRPSHSVRRGTSPFWVDPPPPPFRAMLDAAGWKQVS